MDKLFGIYEAKLSGQMIKSLGKLIIRMHSMGAYVALGISNQDTLSKDLESDLFLNFVLQSFTCSPKFHMRTVLQIQFIPRTSKHWTDYEQALLVGTEHYRN